MGRKVAEMSGEEMASTEEYKRGAEAFKAGLAPNGSIYLSNHQELLFRIGWGDTYLIFRGALLAPLDKQSTFAIDGRSKTRRRKGV
jgi:hypothetical protein